MTGVGLFKASAPGRVCFAGESLDWMCGGSSIVGAIPRRTRVVAWQAPADGMSIIMSASPVSKTCLLHPNGSLNGDRSELEHVKAAMRVVQRRFGVTGDHVLSVSTELPIAAGVSSSAALMLATVGCLTKAVTADEFDLDTVCALAHEAETKELGVGSGWMDFLACGHGGINRISATTPPEVEFMRHLLGAHIILVDTREWRATRQVLQTKRDRLRDRDPEILTYMREATQIVDALASLFKPEQLDYAQIGDLMSAAQKVLAQCMHCSTELIDECIRRVLAAGAFGAKLTGSGYGGCLFAIAPPDAVPGIMLALDSLPVYSMVLRDVEPFGVR